ncbi:hypothetical protein [Acinetobacter sp. ANC 4779]|nr:hypothetical protein [Acinetobacter sp. ANC 4779]
MQDTLAIVVILGTIGAVPFMVRSCSNDVDRQTLQAVKFQAEVK